MNKKLLITIGIILGLAIVVGGFYIASQSQNNADLTQTDTEHKEIKRNNNQKDNQENQENKIKELKAENIDTSNWKEYCNKEYGFCVKYPRNWILKREEKNNAVISLNSPKNEKLLNEIKKGNIYGEGYMEDISINYWNQIKDEEENKANEIDANNLESLINNNRLIASIGKICISGECNAYRIIRYGFSAYYSILIEHNQHLYQIMFGNIQSEDKLSNIDKTIIKSFRFID